MRVRPYSIAINRISLSTGQTKRTGNSPRHPKQPEAVLFLAALAATATVSSRDPVVEWACEIPVLLLGAWWGLRRGWPRAPVGILLLIIALWGFGQLASGTTPDRGATWSASLRMAALCAAAVAAHAILRDVRMRTWFLRAFVCAAFVISVVAVLCWYTARGGICVGLAGGRGAARGRVRGGGDVAAAGEVGQAFAALL